MCNSIVVHGLGSCQVTIEVPARHGNMPSNNFISEEVFLIPVSHSSDNVVNYRRCIQKCQNVKMTKTSSIAIK